MYAWADAGSQALVFTATSRTMEISFKIEYYIFTHVWYMYIYIYVVYMKMHIVHICMCAVYMNMCVHIYMCV